MKGKLDITLNFWLTLYTRLGIFRFCVLISFFFSTYSSSPGLHLIFPPVAPGLSLSVTPSPHLSLIHTQEETHSGIVLCKQGFVPTRGSGLCSNTCMWPWGKLYFIVNYMKKIWYSLSLWLTKTFLVLIFQGLITLLCAKFGLLFHCPEQCSCCGQRLNQPCILIHQWRKRGRVYPACTPTPSFPVFLSLYLPSSLYLFNHTEPYGCTVCCVN